eukprot:gene19625-biopygen981
MISCFRWILHSPRFLVALEYYSRFPCATQTPNAPCPGANLQRLPNTNIDWREERLRTRPGRVLDTSVSSKSIVWGASGTRPQPFLREAYKVHCEEVHVFL